MKIICDACWPELTKSEILKFDRVFHSLIIDLFENRCVNCGHSAEPESGELCADHLEQKHSHPESRYDLSTAVARCLPCHTKRHAGEIPRYPKKEKLPKETQQKQEKVKRPTVCNIAGCPLWALPDKKVCWKHV